MSERKAYGEYLTFDVYKFVERNIKYKGEDIQILITDESGNQEINELQESIFKKLSNKKELDSLNNYCKPIIEKEIKEDFDNERYVHKYNGIQAIRIEKNGIVVIFPTILRQERNNPDEVQIDSARDIRISKYKNILMKGENFMPRKAYSEFMKSKPVKNENNNSTKLKETAVVDKKDSVYGRVLEVAEIFHYTDDPEEDVIIQYALGNDRDYLTRPQLEFHAELQYDAKRLLTKVDTACFKQSSKEIKKDNMYAVLSAFNRLVIDGDGSISAEYYGYVNKGDHPSRPTPEDYQAYEYVDTLKTTFQKAMGRGENMNLKEIMNKTAFGESVVTSGELFGVGEFDEVDKYLKDEFKMKTMDSGKKFLCKSEKIEDNRFVYTAHIYVEPEKGNKVSDITKKRLMTYIYRRSKALSIIDKGIEDFYFKPNKKSFADLNRSYFYLHFMKDGSVGLSIAVYEKDDVNRRIASPTYNVTEYFKANSETKGEAFFGDLVKAIKNKVTEWKDKYRPQYIETIDEYGWLYPEENRLSIQKSYSFDDNRTKPIIKGATKEPVIFGFKDVKDADVKNMSLIQKQIYTKFAKDKGFLDLYNGARDKIKTELELTGYIVFIPLVIIHSDGKVEVDVDITPMNSEYAEKHKGQFGIYTLFVDNVLEKNNKWNVTKKSVKYESVREIRNEYIKAMKLSALSESMADLRGPVQALSERIIKIKDNILDFATFAESVEPTDFAGVAHLQDRKDLIMNDLKTVSNVLDKSDKELNDHYQDSVANSILSLMTVNDSVKAKDLVECPAEKIAKDNEKDIAELKELNPTIGKTVEDKYEEVKDALKNEENDLVYNPTEKKDGLVPVAEMPSGEGFFAYGEAGGADSPEARKFTSDQNQLYKMPVNWQKGGAILAGIGGVGAGLALLHTLMAVPFNIWITSKNNKVEKQFGSALNVQQPLVATDDISKDVINSYAKYLETSAAIQIKQALESSIAQTDGGNLMSRAKTSLRNTFTNMNKTDRSGKNIKDDSEEILSSFSQSYHPVMDCMTKVFSRNAEAASLIFNIQNLVSSGEAGEFINDNKHAPKSTIQVEILYKDINDVTSFSRKTMSKKSSLTVDVSGRKLPYEDVVKTILEMNEKYFGSVKVTPAEKNTEKSLKNSVAFVKKEGTSKEKQVLTSNKFADIINKVERIKTPLFHLVISNQAYHDLKHRGMDIKNKETYRQLMKRLPIISIAIADEDTEIMSYSHGPYPMFRDVQFKDLENEISKYEKELQSMIKFGAQR